MPINIFQEIEHQPSARYQHVKIAYLCEDSWELPIQLFEFERWIEDAGKDLPKGDYVADIGFTQRSDAWGGGGTLSVSAMKVLVAKGIEVWFSEYPDDA